MHEMHELHRENPRLRDFEQAFKPKIKEAMAEAGGDSSSSSEEDRKVRITVEPP